MKHYTTEYETHILNIDSFYYLSEVLCHLTFSHKRSSKAVDKGYGRSTVTELSSFCYKHSENSQADLRFKF